MFYIYKLRDGVLFNEDDEPCFSEAPYFNDVHEARRWLEESFGDLTDVLVRAEN